MRGERHLQIVVLGITILPQRGRFGLHCRDSLRRTAENTFISTDAGTKRLATPALQRLWADKGHALRQAPGKRREIVICHASLRFQLGSGQYSRKPSRFGIFTPGRLSASMTWPSLMMPFKLNRYAVTA